MLLLTKLYGGQLIWGSFSIFEIEKGGRDESTDMSDMWEEGNARILFCLYEGNNPISDATGDTGG